MHLSFPHRGPPNLAVQSAFTAELGWGGVGSTSPSFFRVPRSNHFAENCLEELSHPYREDKTGRLAYASSIYSSR